MNEARGILYVSSGSYNDSSQAQAVPKAAKYEVQAMHVLVYYNQAPREVACSCQSLTSLKIAPKCKRDYCHGSGSDKIGQTVGSA